MGLTERLTERYPEGERDDNEFGDQHLGRSQEADLHIGQNRRLVQFCFRINIPSSLLPNLLGFLHKNDITSCFPQQEPKDREQTTADDELDPKDPMPIEWILVGLDRSSDEWSESDTDHGCHTEDTHWDTSFWRQFAPNVADLPLGPFQISAMDPPTKLIATELAPPPKNRVVIMVAKFVPTPEGTRKMRKTM
jgi:hypothetical protein